jgi:undecaprenyl phosphate-alpha-L-ara4N flippase subunit ArnE
LSTTTILLLVGSQVLLAVSQIFLKHAINLGERTPPLRAQQAIYGGTFIAAMTLWFFLWLGFLQVMPLSKVLPWEGLSPVLLMLGAAMFLKEKIAPVAWLGIAFISAGVVLVSMS